jgi:hypothetical protein
MFNSCAQVTPAACTYKIEAKYNCGIFGVGRTILSVDKPCDVRPTCQNYPRLSLDLAIDAIKWA